jgi:hypothetical protein
MTGTELVYRERAEACRREAATLANVVERDQWLAFAQKWTELADGLAQQRARPKANEPADS